MRRLRFRKTVELDRSNYSAFVTLADIYLTKGVIDKAITNFSKASELRPLEFVPHHNLAVLYARKGDCDSAIRESREALKFSRMTLA